MSVERRRPIIQLGERTGAPVERVVFQGPFGFWVWPLVNLMLTLVERSKQPPAQRRRMVLWDVTRDHEGRIISILEREVSE